MELPTEGVGVSVGVGVGVVRETRDLCVETYRAGRGGDMRGAVLGCEGVREAGREALGALYMKPGSARSPVAKRERLTKKREAQREAATCGRGDRWARQA